MNIEGVLVLDLLPSMIYFWLYRVRDNRPLEESSGIVSQPYGDLVSKPAGTGIPPNSEIHPEPGIYHETMFPDIFKLRSPSWLIFQRLIRKAEEPKRIPWGSAKLFHSGLRQILRAG